MENIFTKNTPLQYIKKHETLTKAMPMRSTVSFLITKICDFTPQKVLILIL